MSVCKYLNVSADDLEYVGEGYVFAGDVESDRREGDGARHLHCELIDGHQLHYTLSGLRWRVEL